MEAGDRRREHGEGRGWRQGTGGRGRGQRTGDRGRVWEQGTGTRAGCGSRVGYGSKEQGGRGQGKCALPISGPGGRGRAGEADKEGKKMHLLTRDPSIT